MKNWIIGFISRNLFYWWSGAGTRWW